MSLELKIPPPLILVLIALGMWGLSRVMPVVAVTGNVHRWAAVLLVLLGAAFSVAGVLAFRRAQTTVNPLRPETSAVLVTGGVYRLTRNPMYAGMLLVLVGWAIWLHSGWALVGPLAFGLYITRFQIAPEERALQRIFGQQFASYCLRVRRWL